MAQVFETLHKGSCMCGKSELDLFTVPATQVEMNKGFWEDVDPVSSIGASDTIEFLCAANSDVYTDLANSYLREDVQAKITNADGSNLAGTAQVGPVNFWMYALFSQVEVYLSNKLVTPSSTSYPYRAYMETALKFSKDAKASLFPLDLYIIRAVPINIKLVRPRIPFFLVSSAGRICFAFVVLAFRLPQS